VEVVHRRCAGIDISKKDAKVCVRVQGWGRRATTASVTTWGAMSNEILALREHLIAEKVTCVVMESTGDYWKPFYYLLEDAVNVMLVNPRDARNRPGRKTDVSDSAWLADLGAHGLLRASLVPPPPIRRLRDLTRARTDLTGTAFVRSIAWRRYCRTPGSNCPRSPPTSWASRAGQCSRR
jgi:transposase